MIPRYQSILFGVLLVASVAMAILLWQLLDRAHQRRMQVDDSAPTQAPLVAPSEQATLYVASDADNALAAQTLSLPLPSSPGSRARVLLGKLLDLYAAPNSPHAVPGGAAAIAQVFLLPAEAQPGAAVSTPTNPPAVDAAANSAASSSAASSTTTGSTQTPTGPLLAVVNLTGAFVASHPSGLETETLTMLSLTATLHANLPEITQVRFLVDGQTRATLAGHADLTRTYLADQAAPTEGIHP
ncbi:GerMN domain-containing protein [Telmatobacter bradus]|uniref:GerMN domain-containing protein n=1 Tax=Telmatobacter bradus TaxID=474953 RepID=UPI003B439440